MTYTIDITILYSRLIVNILHCSGLIYANHGQNIIEYISKELRINQNEVMKHNLEVFQLHAQIVRHGGCLGLGLAAMGTADLGTELIIKV